MANLIDDLSQNQSAKKEKKNGSKFGIILVLFLILILVSGAVAFYLLKFQKKATPKEDFIKYLGNIDFASILNFEKMENLTNRLKNESSESTIDITGNATKNSSEDSESILSDMKVSLDVKKNPLEEKMSSDLELTYKDNKIIAFNVLSNSEDIGILADEVVVKYIASSYENVKDILEKVYNAGTTINFDVNMLKKIDMKLPHFTNDMFANYIEIIQKNSPDTAFSSRLITLDRSSKKIDVTEYTMKLTETQAMNLVKLLLQQFQEDEELLNNLLAPLGDNKELVKEFLKTGIDRINTSLYEKTPDDSRIYTIKVYGTNDMTYKLSLDLFDKYAIDFDYAYEGKNNSMTVTLLETERQGGFSIEIMKKISDVSEDLNFTINMITESEIVGEFKMLIDLVNSGNTSTLKNQFNLNAMIFNANVQMNQKINFKGVEIKDLTDENSVFLDELDQNTLSDIVIAVKKRTIEIINENLVSQQLKPIEIKEEIEEPQEVPEKPQEKIEINPIPSPEKNEELKEAAKTKLVQAISEAMTNAQNEGKTYVLEDLLKLKIPNTILEISIIDEEASIEIDGFEFKINAQFELYE